MQIYEIITKYGFILGFILGMIILRLFQILGNTKNKSR